MTYCPNCISFEDECTPDPEDYSEYCRYFKPRDEDGKLAEEIFLTSLMDSQEDIQKATECQMQEKIGETE